MNIQIKRLRPEEVGLFVELIELFEEVFEMQEFRMPPEEHLQHLLRDNGFYVFVATNDQGAILGGLTAYTLQQYYALKPLVYIYDLAVDSRYQRQGIGTRLIQAINAYCKAKDVQEVFVQADRVDDYALQFYRKTGATEEDVVHFYYNLH